MLPPPAAAQVYELTDLGAQLEPVVMALGDFGSHLPIPDDCPMRMSFDSHMLSLRTLFAADRAEDMVARMQLVLDGGPTTRRRRPTARSRVEPGEAADPDADDRRRPDRADRRLPRPRSR